jgi:hypothetical protein
VTPLGLRQVFRFNLHGALQHAGLDVGQFVGIRGELDGEIVQGMPIAVSHMIDDLSNALRMVHA